MMCQRIGMPPISTIGLGRTSVSSLSRVPEAARQDDRLHGRVRG